MATTTRMVFGFLFLLPFAAALGERSSARSGSTTIHNQGHRQLTRQTKGCILQKLAKEYSGGTPSTEEWQCELQGDDAKKSRRRFVSVEGIDVTELKDIRSGETSLLVENGEITPDGKLLVSRMSEKTLEKAGHRGPAARNTKNSKKGGTNSSDQRRKLNPLLSNTREDHTVLAVRIRANDFTTVSPTWEISDKIFGTSGDRNNLRERYDTCSFGELTMSPFIGETDTGVFIANGVYEIGIDMNVKDVDDGLVREEAARVLEDQLGDLPSQFDHVMLCLPPETSGSWIGYGYIGGWMSVFNDEWCNFPSIQMHEIGHNLRLQHAWEEGEGKYHDQSGLMGFSYNDDTSEMCLNPAKAWQLGWYGRRRTMLDFSRDPGFKGRVIGIIDYDNPSAGDSGVVLRVVSESFDRDVFIGFNRDTGMNGGTIDARNKVTVTTQADASASNLVAKLRKDENHYIPNFQGDLGLNVKVNKIDLSVIPSYAEIEVYLDGCPHDAPSKDCTNACVADNECDEGNPCVVGTCNSGMCSYDTSSCPGDFNLFLSTDYWGGETSWELINTCTGAVAARGGNYGGNQQYSFSRTIGQDPHKLALYDSWGDGINPPGGLTASFDGLEVASASGDFNHDEYFYFGSMTCGVDGGDDSTYVFNPVRAPPEIANPEIFFVSSEPSVLLEICEGDCDSDDECGPGLACFLRRGLEEVPGCSKSTEERSGWDFCYPHVSEYGPLVFVSDSPSAPLNVCEGDCDSDADCAEGLLCYFRGSGLVPGCSFANGSYLNDDFCYNPKQDFYPSGESRTSAPIAPTPAPINPSPAPVAPTLAPITPTPSPVLPIPPPVEPTVAPVAPTLDPSPAPVVPTLAPIMPTPSPVLPIPAPVEPTAAPVAPTLAPVVPTTAPVKPTPAPVFPTSSPVAPTSMPVAPTLAPVALTPAPVVPTSAPVEPTPSPLSPTPAPENPISAWIPIFYESFEDGEFGIFNRGGKQTKIDDKEASDGSYSLEIKDDKGDNSASRSDMLDVSGFNELRVNFWFYSKGADYGESFYLEWSDSGSSNSWQTIHRYREGEDFQNEVWTESTQSWNVSGIQGGFLRFRGGFNDGKEKIILDQITLEGRQG